MVPTDDAEPPATTAEEAAAADLLSPADGGARTPLPASMAVPFAVLGAAAAWFCVLGVSFFVKDARFTSPWPAPLVGGLVGALAGVALRRWRVLHHPDLANDRRLLRIALVVGSAGAVIGAVVTAWTARGALEAGVGALDGLLCAMIFVPGASFVVDAAVRATRARHGSIVAGADRRSIWSTTLAATAVAPVLAVPATASGRINFGLGILPQAGSIVLGALVALVALATLEAIEQRARRRLERAVEETADLEEAHATDGLAPGAADLGLGEAGRARRRLRDAYRGARHVEVVLRGDPDEARHALDDAVARRRRACVLALVALVTTFASGFALGSDAPLTPFHLASELRTGTPSEAGSMGTSPW